MDTKNKNVMIPWAKPVFWGNEKKYIDQALDSTWISGGAFIERLEVEFSNYCKSRFALSASNGTTAIHMAYLALGLKPGDEIIVPGFGFLAAANLAVQMGAKPIFAEVDPHTWCLTAASIERCISKATRVIVPVHTYGNVCPMDDIMELAGIHKLSVVEDAAEAFASRYNGKFAGSFGEIGTFSFQATKTITTGEGGMVVTNYQALKEQMALFKSHGMLRKTYYWHELPGHNFRMTNLQAALGCAQMEHLDTIIRERGRIHERYKHYLERVEGLQLQHFEESCDPVLWALAVKLDPKVFPRGRDKVMDQMKAAGIETRPGFYTPDNFPYLKCPQLSICKEISDQVISLPSFPTLTDAQIEFICSELIKLSTNY